MNRKNLIAGLISIVVLLSLWEILSRVFGSDFILPSPVTVFVDCALLVREPGFPATIGATCLRGLLAFAISLVLAIPLGFAAGAWPVVNYIMKPWMSVIKSTPVVAFILIAILWLGSSTVPIFVSVLMTLPVMTEAVTAGVRSSDPKLLEMARVYRFGLLDRVLHIQLPSALPYFLGGAGTSLGLTWKVVVAGEILGLPRLGIGSAMQTAKVHLETPRVFSLTIAAIALSVATDLAFGSLVRASRRHSQIEERS